MQDNRGQQASRNCWGTVLAGEGLGGAAGFGIHTMDLMLSIQRATNAGTGDFLLPDLEDEEQLLSSKPAQARDKGQPRNLANWGLENWSLKVPSSAPPLPALTSFSVREC